MGKRGNMYAAVLIPAYQPDERLLTLAEDLAVRGLPVLVVDDGSTDHIEIFDELEAAGHPVLHHAQNRGKGAALKTGIAWLHRRGFDAVVTADADGQHTPDDIARLLAALRETPDRLVLGVRDVAQMPARSRFGNTLTRHLFGALYHTRVSDTQTGLRAFALTDETVPRLDALPGDRYEYEMEMLRDASGIWPAGIREVPIDTIYIGRNETSHFHVIRDSFRVYRVLLGSLPRFLASSVLAFALDYGLFTLLYSLVFRHTTPATVLARVCSAGVNYQVNRRLVFPGGSPRYNLRSYVLLAAGILAANTALMYLLVEVLALPAAPMKVIVEVVLWLASYLVQSRLANASAQGKCTGKPEEAARSMQFSL